MARKIFSPGSAVTCGGHRCTVIAVTLRESFVGYQVCWWNSGVRHVENVSECEMDAVPTSKFIIIAEPNDAPQK